MNAKRCGCCGQFMRREYTAPGGWACSLMIYSHAYHVWEHQ